MLTYYPEVSGVDTTEIINARISEAFKELSLHGSKKYYHMRNLVIAAAKAGSEKIPQIPTYEENFNWMMSNWNKTDYDSTSNQGGPLAGFKI